MKTLVLLLLLAFSAYSQSLAPVQHIFMQGNNINTVFSSDGTFNYDKVTMPYPRSGSSGRQLHNKD